MIKYVEFAGFTEEGVKDYGRIILEKGKLRAEGGYIIDDSTVVLKDNPYKKPYK